jgi:transcriptional regulator with XRE-family HTH domain
MQLDDFIKLPARKLAQMTDTDETVWSKYFRGRRSPTVSTLEKIALTLDMKPEEILSGIRQRQKKPHFKNGV